MNEYKYVTVSSHALSVTYVTEEVTVATGNNNRSLSLPDLKALHSSLSSCPSTSPPFSSLISKFWSVFHLLVLFFSFLAVVVVCLGAKLRHVMAREMPGQSAKSLG